MKFGSYETGSYETMNIDVEHLDQSSKDEAQSWLEHLAGIALGGIANLDALEQAVKADRIWEYQSGMEDGRYRLLLEQLPVVTFMARLEGDFSEMYVSPQIEAMLGYSQQEWLGNPILWYERLHPEDKARWNTEFSRFLMLDEPFRSVYRFIARDGQVVWVRGEVKIVRDALGRPVYLQGIGFDITEIKQADEALKKAHEELERRVEERTAMLAQTNAALQEEIAERKRSQEELERTEMQLLHSAKLASLGTLATGVAHELNQPLAGIRAIAQQLLHEEELPEYCLEDVKIIEQQTHRMTKIINHLRTFARAPSHEVVSVDINQVVQNCFILIGQQLKSHGIVVELALCPEPLNVHADASELEQVVLNLVTNARDALEGRPDARITLRSRQEGERILLEVCDNGPGVPQEYINRIFDPFFTTKDIGKGTGLGLSISYNILSRFGGTLEYRTENGAIFTITLPFDAL
jgi:PAS domain S-box-containing protein